MHLAAPCSLSTSARGITTVTAHCSPRSDGVSLGRNVLRLQQPFACVPCCEPTQSPAASLVAACASIAPQLADPVAVTRRCTRDTVAPVATLNAHLCETLRNS